MSRREILNIIVECLLLQTHDWYKLHNEQIIFKYEDIKHIYDAFRNRSLGDESIGYYVRVYLEINYFEI